MESIVAVLTQFKVANKMETEVKKVKLYKQTFFGPGSEYFQLFLS